MTELVVASGKGGTGKTSLVASLAELAGRAVLVDCDVDAANLHLVIPHRVEERHEFSAGRKATIVTSRCNGCGICLEKCRFDAITAGPDPDQSGAELYHIKPFACEGCGLCVQLCPEEAIGFDLTVSGHWFRSISDYGPFLHAKLGIAESNSGRLVSLLRQRAREEAKTAGLDLVIIDGPPGIGCPVISSLTNAGYLLIVTEPSVSALHDMERLIELSRHFAVPVGIVVNKFDLNSKLTQKIEQFARKCGLAVHGRVPYDRKFVEAQVQGKAYIQVADPAKGKIIRGIWETVREALRRTGPVSGLQQIQNLTQIERTNE